MSDAVGRRTLKVFQSTLPHGERHLAAFSMSSSSPFQSTLPHGERRYFGTSTPV